MQLSQRQQQTLAALDIPVWKRRQTVPVMNDVVVTEDIAITANIDLSPAVWVVTASTVVDDKAQRLLGAMLKAVGLSRKAVAMLNCEQIQAVAEAEMYDKTVLVLGNLSELVPETTDPAQPEKIAHHADSHWIVTYSLSEIMARPSLKASVWQALKLLKTSD